MDFLRELMGEMKQQIVSLRGEMKEQNVSLRGEIKQQNVGLRGELKQINKHCDDIIEKMKDRTEKWKRDADKYNENKDDQVMDTKVGDVSESNMIMMVA